MPVLKRKSILTLAVLLVGLSLVACDSGVAERNGRATQVANTVALNPAVTPYNVDTYAPLSSFDALNYISAPAAASYLATGVIVDRQYLDLDGDRRPEALLTLAYKDPAGGDPLLNMVVSRYYTPSEAIPDETITPTPNSSRGIDLIGWAPLWPSYLLYTPTPAPTDTPVPTEVPTTPSATATSRPTRTPTATPGGPTATPFTPSPTPTVPSPTPGATYTPTPTPTPLPTLTSAQLAAFLAKGQVYPLPANLQGQPISGGAAVIGLRYVAVGQQHLRLWVWQNETASPLKFNGQGETLTASVINIADLGNDGKYEIVTTDSAGKQVIWQWDGQQFSPQQ